MAKVVIWFMELLETIFTYLGSVSSRIWKRRSTVTAFIGQWFNKANQARASLAATMLTLFFILFLLPLVVMGTSNYFRSRALLRDQASSQMQSISKFHGDKIEETSLSVQRALNQLIAQPDIDRAIETLLSNPDNKQNKNLASFLLREAFKKYSDPTSGGNALIDQIVIINKDGKVLASTNRTWDNQDFSNIKSITPLLGNSTTNVVFNPNPLYFNRLVVFASTHLAGAKYIQPITIVATSLTGTPADALLGASSFLQYSHAYLLTQDHNLIGVSPNRNELFQLVPDEKYQAALDKLITKGDGFGQINLDSTSRFLVYTSNLPHTNAHMVIEVPQYYVLRQVSLFDPYNLLLLAISLLIMGAVVFASTTNIVNPLLQLSNQMHSFASGNLEQRSNINRADEIGLLANAFNRMGDQLSDLYRSLETRVEARVRQVRTASRIAQIATASGNQTEISRLTSSLIVELMGYPFASVFLLDENGRYALLEASSDLDVNNRMAGVHRISVSNDSLIGWAAANNTPRAIVDVEQDPYGKHELIRVGTRSEVAIPLSNGNQTIGVLEIQSNQIGAFDNDAVSVLQALTEQIAASLQRARLVESKEVSLDEINALYQTGREITHASTESEALQSLTTVLSKTAYVSAVFDVQESYLTILAIRDPRSPGSGSTTQGITLPLQHVVVRLLENPLIIIEDLSHPSDFDNVLNFFSRRGCRSAALLAVYEGKNLTKIMVLGSRAERPVAPQAMQPYTVLSDVFGNTLHRLHATQNIVQQLTDIEAIEQFNQAISHETELPGFYQTLHNELLHIIGGCTSFKIVLHNPETGLLETPFAFEQDLIRNAEPYPLSDDPISQVIKKSSPLLLNRESQRSLQEQGIRFSSDLVKSWLGIPLIYEDHTLGALVFQENERPERFTQHDLKMGLALAPHIAATLNSIQLLTARLQALKKYTADQIMLNAWMNTKDFYFYAKDAQGRYTRASRAYCNLVGISPETPFLDHTDRQLLGEEIGARNQAEMEHLFASGVRGAGRLEKHLWPDGKESWFQISQIPIYDPTNTPVGLLCIMRDITTLKNSEDLSQARAQQLRTAAEIARDTAGTLELNELLSRAVSLVKDRFGFYHSSIFLLDPLNEFAVLRESTGDAGARLKSTGHKLRIGSQSIIGQTTSRGTPIVVNDVNLDPNYYANPLLPDTHSELAIPLKVGDRIVGALDVQSTQTNAFTEESISILQILADQLAIAVYNANLFTRTEETLSQHRLIHQITTTAASKDSVDDILVSTVKSLHDAEFGSRIAIFIPNEHQILEMHASSGYPLIDLTRFQISYGQGTIGRAAQSMQPVRVDNSLTESETGPLNENSRSQLAVPITYANNLLGILSVESDELAAFDQDDQEILATLGNNLGAVLFSANLLGRVRLQVERQQQLFNITNKIRRAVDVPSVLQTSASELGKALKVRRAHIEITINQPQAQPSTPIKKNGNGHKEELQ